MLCCCTDGGNANTVEALPAASALSDPPIGSTTAAEIIKQPIDTTGFQEIEVVIQKDGGQLLAVDISAVRKQCLKVWKIKPGLVSAYNEGKPEEEQISTGDAIMEVNGARGNSDDILSQIAKADILTMKIAKGIFIGKA
mmetsp:Transcript_10881/g.19366  ORF Transcript_10881/g.19366 Transcript_10881/m.19366 type:complete len:139 (+) Transcript_10881:101-517(+)